jgi:hypothetical protein
MAGVGSCQLRAVIDFLFDIGRTELLICRRFGRRTVCKQARPASSYWSLDCRGVLNWMPDRTGGCARKWYSGDSSGPQYSQL